MTEQDITVTVDTSVVAVTVTPPEEIAVTVVPGVTLADVQAAIGNAVTALVDGAPTDADTLLEMLGEINDLAAAVYTKTQVDTLFTDEVGDLGDLQTTDKTNVVAAVNEVKNATPVIEGHTVQFIQNTDPAGADPEDPDYGDGLSTDDLWLDTSTE